MHYHNQNAFSSGKQTWLTETVRLKWTGNKKQLKHRIYCFKYSGKG